MKKRMEKLFTVMLIISVIMSMTSIPAFAADAEIVTFCGKHVHGDGCYASNLTCDKTEDLICGIEAHEHSLDANCYHQHSTECYSLTCGIEPGTIECGLDEKTCSLDACTLTEVVCGNEGHVEGTECEGGGNYHSHEGCHFHGTDCTHQHDESCKHVHSIANGCYAAEAECGTAAGALVCNKEHSHVAECKGPHTHDDECYEKILTCDVTEIHYHTAMCYWNETEMTLSLPGGTYNESITLPDGATLIVNGDVTIAAGTANAINCEGELTVIGNGKLNLTGKNGIKATSVSISNIDVEIDVTSCGIYVMNGNGDSTVTLTKVDGNIAGDAAGIYVFGNTVGSNASAKVDQCNLKIESHRTSGYGRLTYYSGISVCTEGIVEVDCSIDIINSVVNASGCDAGLAVNNYTGGENSSGSALINISGSTVVAEGKNTVWSGIFASVLGEHADANSYITITDSSVYSASINTGVMTSSQNGVSGIVLDNSILGAGGATALRMIEDSAQKQTAELKNNSTYVQLTPMAVNAGTIDVFEGKSIIATAGDGITYDAENNYYVIPQGSAVTETFTDGTVKEYTFNNQAGGIGGFSYEKEEIWGYDLPEDVVAKIVETGVFYETLAEAVADANALEGANTIEMLKSIDFDSSKALEVTGDLTIIGEYTISRGAYTGTLFKVPTGSSLTLDGGIVFDGSNNWVFNKELYDTNLYALASGTVWGNYITSEEGGTKATAPMFVVNGSVDANDVTVQNSYSDKGNSNNGGFAIFQVNSGAELTMDGATLTHIAANSCSVITGLNSGTWNITGDTLISENFAGLNGGLCRNNSGLITMSSGTIKDNTAINTNGIAFMMYSGSSVQARFEMTGGTICGNSGISGGANGHCAAVYLHNNSYMKMTGGTICHNIGGTRGGIDNKGVTSTLEINRADQDFNNPEWKESGAAAYTEANHPRVVDNVSLSKKPTNDVGHGASSAVIEWWIKGGIYTQDVDEFCAEGYVCIPYADSERTDDYIVVPGYRVNYYAVEKAVTTDAETGAENTEYNTTLVNKYFHLLPRDKFWYEMDERANDFTFKNDEGKVIDTWYTEQEMINKYDFTNTKLEGDLNLYGAWVEDKTPENNNPPIYIGPIVTPTPEPNPAPTPEPPLIEVEDPEVPLEEPDVPQAEPEVEIVEEEVPLTDVPKTADNTDMMLWLAMAALSAMALLTMRLTEKKEY